MNMPLHALAITTLELKAIYGQHVASSIRRRVSNTALIVYKSGLTMITKFNLTALLACCLFGTMPLPKAAWAQVVGPESCAWTAANKTVTVPTVTFPADAPIGTVVSVSGAATGIGNVGAYCNSSTGSIEWEVGYYGLAQLTLVSGYTDVWATNYPGLGVRIPIGQNNTSSPWGYLHATRIDTPAAEFPATGGVGTHYLIPSNGWNINVSPLPFQFVKTSNALRTGNVPATRLLATYYTYYFWRETRPAAGPTHFVVPNGSNTFYGYYLLNGFQVIEPTPTCSLATSSATFNMGTVPVAAFTGVGSVQPWVADQSLVSGGCNASTVSMTFAGTAAPAPYNSAFANSGTAQGIGLQLWPASGAQAIPNGAPITFAAQGAGGLYTFSARYIQTAPTVVGGSVSATVTVTLNYQ